MIAPWPLLSSFLPLRRNKKSTRGPPHWFTYAFSTPQTKMIVGNGTRPTDHGSKAIGSLYNVPRFPVIILVLVGQANHARLVPSFQKKKINLYFFFFFPFMWCTLMKLNHQCFSKIDYKNWYPHDGSFNIFYKKREKKLFR